MAYRNIEIDHLIIGYLLTRDDDRPSDHHPPTVSGASDPRMLADTKASEHPHTPAIDAAAHELAGGAKEPIATRQVV